MPTYPYIISILYYINQAYITAQSDYSGVSWAVKSAAVNLNFAIETISIESLTIKKVSCSLVYSRYIVSEFAFKSN